MKLRPGIIPFRMCGIRIPGQNATAYAGTVPWHFTGISRPVPVSRLPSEDQRETGCSFILTVATNVRVGAQLYTCMAVAYTRDVIWLQFQPGWFLFRDVFEHTKVAE